MSEEWQRKMDSEDRRNVAMTAFIVLGVVLVFGFIAFAGYNQAQAVTQRVTSCIESGKQWVQPDTETSTLDYGCVDTYSVTIETTK